MFDGLRSSPRQQRRVFFASLVLLAAGIAALLAVVVLPSRQNALDTPISNVKAQSVKKDPVAPVDPVAIAIARKFLATAVVRKNLDWAYDNVHVDMKGRMTRQQWDRGDIPVVPFDAQNAGTTAFIPVFHLRDEVEFMIVLVPRRHAVYAGENVRQFFIGLKREHDSPRGRWLVSYFEPDWKPPILLQQ